ncbi:hypothetical protein SDD30_05650 [Moorella naiadis]|uniref:lipoate--protein ligase family protein n=1 Tax=Moorella naiadis (nom. illeg.) TaxID=3093670 RepID=UPI003D9C99E7
MVLDFPAYPGDILAVEAFKRVPQESLYLSEPEAIAVVLGRGTKAEKEINLHACRDDHVPVLRRRGGGGAVVLAPGMMVITAVFLPTPPWLAETWLLNLAWEWVEVLTALGIKQVQVRGYGDVCIGDRKILGASLYISKEMVLYQASLLVNCDLNLLPRYLAHPLREPIYRAGRGHLDFVTNLTAAGYQLKWADLVEGLTSWWAERDYKETLNG